MPDLAYAFTLYFVTLGPLKTVPAFYLVTQSADRRTTVALAVRSAIVATAIVLFVALVASGTMVTWRVSADSIAIAGGVVLLMSAIRALTSFHLAEAAPDAVSSTPRMAMNLTWMGSPVLSPLAIPSIVTPIGIVVVLYFSGLALGDSALQGQIVGLLLVIMGLNLVAMMFARPIMRAVGLPILQVIGWVFSALQAGLAVEVLMGAMRRLAIALCVALAFAGMAAAQELDPRAFAPAPVGTTIVLAGIGESTGGILFDPSVGVADVDADLHIITSGFGYTFGLAGRQARVLAVVPVAWGNIAGNVHAQPQRQDLRGLADPRIKVSIGLRGAPALRAAQFASVPRGTAIGMSVTVMPPLGQYNSGQLVNLGYNRWGLKPEIGATRTINRWTFDAATGVWFFTTNRAYYPGLLHKEQEPLVSVQGHVSYAFPNRIWIGVAGTWFGGGETRVAGIVNPDEQRNTRLGATLSLPIDKFQSVKVVYSTGATTRRGNDFNSFSVNWQLARY
jgi:small neutral amino acid transporter SnatA (MarC family)